MLPHYRSVAPFAAVLGIIALATAVQAGNKLYSGSLILHDFANDTTSGKTPPYATYTFLALPLGAHCNPANGGKGKECRKATLQNGAPLVGPGSDTATSLPASPFGFRLGKADLEIETSGSLPPYSGVSYTLTTAELENNVGLFSAGRGPGSFSFVPALGWGSTRAVVAAGKKQFGGVMGLVGKFGTRNAGRTLGGGRWYGRFPDWGVQVAGGSYAEMTTVEGTFSFTSPEVEYKSIAVVTGFPWTTGRVSVSAAGGSGFPTRLVRSGYDNRTPGGGGTIQMVTPRLTHWAAGSHWGDIAVLRVQFAPEPESWLLLAAGLSLVAVLHHSGAGRARRNQNSSTR
jgi:hypothetical protein